MRPAHEDPDRLAADEEYTTFVRARLDQWRRVAYLMAGSWDAGDDLVQRVLTELYRKWPRLRRAESLDGVVRRMLTRRLLDERRLGWSRVRLTGTPAGPDLPDWPLRTVGESPDTRVADRMDIARALRGLPPRQRAVLVLRFFHDLSVDETAEALRCSSGTVKSQTAKGLSTLRRLLTLTALIN